MCNLGQNRKPRFLQMSMIPTRSRAERVAVDSFGHQHHIFWLPMFCFRQNLVDLFQVLFVAHDKLQLEIGRVVDESLNRFEIQPLLFVGDGKPPALAFNRGGVRQLGR